MVYFRELKITDALQTLQWRTSDRISKFMVSDIQFNLEKQRKWIIDVFHRSDYYAWIIANGDQDLGLVYLEKLDVIKKEAHWGFYIGDVKGIGLGGRIPPYFYNFAFNNLGLEKIKSSVFYNNPVVEMHLRQGCKFDASTDYVIEKNNREILVVSMVLDADRFNNSRYKRFKKEFPTNKWIGKPL